MKKYELMFDKAETNNGKLVKPGVTYELNGGDGWNPTLIQKFNDKDEALEELKHYKTQICELASGRLNITEYFVIENEYNDEDGEFIWGGDISDFSAMEIGLWNLEQDVIVKKFDNYPAAEKALEEYRETREWNVEPVLYFGLEV